VTLKVELPHDEWSAVEYVEKLWGVARARSWGWLSVEHLVTFVWSVYSVVGSPD
jgi:hypothetical protein